MGTMKDRKMKSAPLERSQRETWYLSFWGHVPEHGERQPEEEDELEAVVEGEPVDDADEALDDAGKRC